MVNDDFIRQLENGLEGVTPGPWQKSGVVAQLVSQKCQAVGPDAYNIAFVPVGRTDADYMGALRDAYHIARCSPENIRGLIARLRMAQAALLQAQAALEPFAAVAKVFDYNINPAPNKDDDDVYTWYPKYLPPDEFVTIKVGDFRRARAALEGK